MNITENEFRVRAVTRFVVTHFTATNYGNGRMSGGSEQYGEFPNIYQAEAVAKALHQTSPGSTFATIEEKREPLMTLFAYTEAQAKVLNDLVNTAEWQKNWGSRDTPN